MSLYEKRKEEFKKTVLDLHGLPQLWQVKFSDGEDQRLWFDNIQRMDKFEPFVDEIEEILNKFNKELLSNRVKEVIFLNLIEEIKRIPARGEFTFDDNEDMHKWYINYAFRNRRYERLVYNELPEYMELDLAEIWSDIRKEFTSVIKRLKRIPNYGEVKLQRGIDVNIIFAKLETFDPEFVEKLRLHLETYKEKHLSPEDRLSEFLEMIKSLGYIPALQECRFSDNCDMLTWYLSYKDKIPALKDVDSLITNESKKTKVNVYFIPNFKKSGGKFYTICTNVGEVLDLSAITSYEEAKQIDPSFTKRGGLILKKDEEIGGLYSGRSKK